MEIHGSLIKTSYFQLFLHCCHNTSQFSPEGRQALIQICGVSQVITSTPEFSSYSFNLSCLCWQRLMGSPREAARLSLAYFPLFLKLLSL